MTQRTLRTKGEKLIEAIFLISGSLSILAVVFITVFIFIEGLPLFTIVNPIKFLFSSHWAPTANEPSYGIFSFIMGSLWVTGGALFIAVPVGLSVGIFMSEMAKGAVAEILRRAIELLAGIPSVVYGLFGYIGIAPMIRKFVQTPLISRLTDNNTGLGILSASIVLAIMTLPTIINITEVSLRSVRRELKEGSLALGTTHWQTIVKVLIPAAKSGIIAGIILGMGRAIGETMAVLMVAGNAVVMPKGIFSLTRTLTMNIVTDMKYAADIHQTSLFSTGIVLFIFILALNILVQYLMKRNLSESKGERK